MGKRDNVVLNKILKETTVIKDMTDGYDCARFVNDEKTKRAVCMTLINIGEMVKLLSESIRADNSEVPWRSISGLRDVTAHGYQTLRMEDIWETIITDIPILKEQIEKILK
jgi:uncharacterized protein with HEPN domain